MNTEAFNDDEDENFTKLKSPIKNKANKNCEITPTQVIDESSCSPKQPQTTFPKKPLQIVSKETLSAAYGRHLVEEVEETPSAIVLTLTDLTSELKRICHLKGSWMETQVKPKDIVNILSVNVNDTKGITIGKNLQGNKKRDNNKITNIVHYPKLLTFNFVFQMI